MRERRFPFGLSGEPPASWLGIVVMLATVGLGTLVVYPLKSIAPAVSLGVVLIPGVLLISTVWGWRLGLVTALLSAVAFNWFHIPPVGRFEIADNRDVVALVVFGIVAIGSSTLAELARARASEAERRREETDRVLGELRALSRERDRMQAEAIEAEALRRSDELKTALLRSVSHDLRTPLTSMIAAGAALDSPSATPAERHELSQAVVEQGRRLSRLVENLLDVSRLESGRVVPNREPVDLGELLEAARRSIGAGQEKVRLAIDAELPALSADAAQLERAFANLLENAVRHGNGKPVLVPYHLLDRQRCRQVLRDFAGDVRGDLRPRRPEGAARRPQRDVARHPGISDPLGGDLQRADHPAADPALAARRPLPADWRHRPAAPQHADLRPRRADRPVRGHQADRPARP
jgi:K+-sensing histidine kinase KdpD